MNLSDFKFSSKEIAIGLTFIGGFFFQWYTLKMEIREQFLEAGFQKKTNESHFVSVDNSIASLVNRVNSLERKSQRLFYMLYKDFDKPKPIEFKDEE